MRKKRIMISIMSAALVAVVAIGGTLAYLSEKTDSVTNTFTVGVGYEEDAQGHKGLWLDEVDITDPTGETRTESGNHYKDLLPTMVMQKDPTFHLVEGSTESYVFAEIQGLDELLEKGFIVSDTAFPEEGYPEPASNLNGNWKKISEGIGQTYDGIYVYKTTVGGDKSTEMAPLFNYIKFSSKVTSPEFDAIDRLEDVVIRGVAVQATNMTEELAAHEAAAVLYP